MQQSYYRLLPDEVEAINVFVMSYSRVNYREPSYMMLDQHLVVISESAVCRMLREADLLCRYGITRRGPLASNIFKPAASNRQIGA